MSAAEVTRIEVTMTVPGSHTWTDCYGVEFTVETVAHRAFVYSGNGSCYRTATLYGTNAKGYWSNDTLSPLNESPSWLPAAPRGWQDIADAIVSKAVK